MNRTIVAIFVAAASCAFTATASAGGWVGDSPCAARDRELADSGPDGTAANDNSHARLSVTVDSRGGSDISLELGDPPVQHHTWGTGHSDHEYESRETTCLPQRHPRLGPN